MGEPQRASTQIRRCYIVTQSRNVDNILYAIDIFAANFQWTVYRTLSAFQILKTFLVQASIPQLPPFPGVQYMSPITIENINNIRTRLDSWLNQIMENEYVQHVQSFQEFMRAEANNPPAGMQQIIFPESAETESKDMSPADDDEYYKDKFPVLRSSSDVTINDFALLKVIGKGSFGKVFQVRKNGQEDIFAMKVLDKSLIRRKNQIEHTQTERNILGLVDHPFIVGMKYAFQTKDKLYFVLDYCPGGELFFHLGKEKKFSEDRARFYAAEIVLALEHLHKRKIVYRDLKPENVLLTEDGHIRLTDFGLSKENIVDADKGAQSFCGTPEYLAPEILNRTGHGQAVDWWSLGALLYEMLTGWPPFYSRDQERLFTKIKRAKLDIPQNISADAADILSRLLEKNPVDRLGGSTRDADDVKSHPFFKSIDWDKLFRKAIAVPFVPEVKDILDTSQFSSEFTSLPISSPSSYNVSANNEDLRFPNFSFVATAPVQEDDSSSEIMGSSDMSDDSGMEMSDNDDDDASDM